MKQFLFALLYASRIVDFVSWLHRKRVTVLCYHSVIAEGQEPAYDPHKQHIPVSLFVQHLDYLKKNHRIISLTDLHRSNREQRRLPDYSVVLIFDDGFEDFYSVVAPELFRRQIPATVFVITHRASKILPPNGESFLSWEEIRELSTSGITIGSHTCSHPDLTALSPDQVARELNLSREAILEHVAQAEVPLSYPFGSTSAAVARAAESAGYSCAIGGDHGPNVLDANPYQLSRTVIASDDNLATFAARVSGLTSAFCKLRQRFSVKHKDRREGATRKPYPSAMAESFE